LADSQIDSTHSSTPEPDGARRPDRNNTDLAEYFRSIWRHKALVLAAAVLPPLIVATIIFLQTRRYRLTFLYDLTSHIPTTQTEQTVRQFGHWSLDENNYLALLDRFYSIENIDIVASNLREQGLSQYALRLQNAETSAALKKLLSLEALPPWPDFSKVNAEDLSNLGQLQQFQASLLKLTIVGNPKNAISEIAAVMRNNLENVMSLYIVERELRTVIRNLKTQMADIETDRFSLNLAVKTNKAVLDKLKNIKTTTSNQTQTNIALQFDLGGKSEYLPLDYQIQAAESKIVDLEEKLTAAQERYDHYRNLLALNEELADELKKRQGPHYTIQQFHEFLLETISKLQSTDTSFRKDYIEALVKHIENRIAANVPITEQPRIETVPTGVIKTTAVVFVISIMAGVFLALILETIQKKKFIVGS